MSLTMSKAVCKNLNSYVGRTATQEEMEICSRTLQWKRRAKVDADSTCMESSTAHRHITTNRTTQIGKAELEVTDELQNFIKNRLQPGEVFNDVCTDPDFWTNHESNFINRIMD